MKRTFLLAFCCIFFVGCISIKYNAKTGQLSYFRYGKQIIDNLSIVKEGENVKFKLKKLTVEEEEFSKLIELLANTLDVVQLKGIVSNLKIPTEAKDILIEEIIEKTNGGGPENIIENNVSDNAGINTGSNPDPAALPFDWSEINWLNGIDISSWPVTSELKVSLKGNKILLDYDKTNVWKNNDQNLNANCWVFLEYNGKWYGSTWEFMREGYTEREKAALEGGHIGMNPLKAWKPIPGDVLYLCNSGLARGPHRNVSERTSIKKLIWE